MRRNACLGLFKSHTLKLLERGHETLEHLWGSILESFFENFGKNGKRDESLRINGGDRFRVAW